MKFIKQTNTTCQNCPLLADGDRGSYFPPEVLNRTVGEYYKKECLHPCHANQENFCTGFLAFVKQNHPCGFSGYTMGRIAMYLKLLTPCDVPDLNVFDTIDEMLEDNAQRRFSTKRTKK